MNVASIKKLMCGKYKPNDQFFDIFNSTNDIRYALTFDSVLYEQFNSTNKTLILKKLWRTDGNCPMFYMRLAQMKLFQAEALERNGASVADVLAPLNDLRRRSGNCCFLSTGIWSDGRSGLHCGDFRLFSIHSSCVDVALQHG